MSEEVKEGVEVQQRPTPQEEYKAAAQAALAQESSQEVVIEKPKEAPVEPPGVLIKYFKEKYGYDFGENVTDADVAPRIGELLEERQLLQQHALDMARQIQELQKGTKPEAKPQPGESQEPQLPQWEKLEINPELRHLVTFNRETEEYEPKAKLGHISIEAANNLNAYERKRRERAERLTSDPWSFIREAGAGVEIEGIKSEFKTLREELKKEILESFQTQKKEEDSRGEVNDWINTNHKDLFVTDSKGQAKEVAGKFLLTEKGRLYQQAVKEAEEFGIKDHANRHHYAVRQYELATRTVTPTPTAKEQGDLQKKMFLEKGHQGAAVPTERSPAPIGSFMKGALAGPLRFREMALQDPDNAELLGAHFKG